jgi:hypothetical protein
MCVEAKTPGSSEEECENLEEKIWNDRIKPYPIPLVWQPDWTSRLFVVGVVVDPPAAAYGLFRLGWLLIAWIMRGFKQI